MTAASSSRSPCLSASRLYIVFHQVLFLVTGLITTLGVQWLFYTGAATGDSYLTQLSQYIGMVLVGLLIPVILARQRKAHQYTSVSSNADDGEDERQRISMEVLDDGQDDKLQGTDEVASSTSQDIIDGPIKHKSVFKLAVLDVVANFCVTLGFSVIGSGMYQVIYSSVVIWCAILTYIFMGRTLTRLQWIAIFGTSAGLALSSFGNFDVNDNDEEQGAAKLMLGTIMTMGGTFFYSCVYVYSDCILSKQIPPPLAARVCYTTGLYATAMSILWVGIYTLPQLDSLVNIDPDVSSLSVVAMYALVTVANATHSWNYYELVDRTGNVATGILQGLRAILVYILSHMWYCNTDAAQCKRSTWLLDNY
ncbi:hypothetical protein K492DRAFT_198070 [Lichtheimia hyalospora FSU 10163]|nr:hypothetical protein K492DRAFT_198070 [Lichtheimia hyalospora FSU 10163]